MTIERMFLAVTPPPEVIDLISDLPTEALRGVRYTRRKQWHISLRFLGDVERQAALDAFAGFSAPAVTINLGDQVELLGTRVVILPVQGLDATAQAIDASFEHLGEPRDHQYQAHLTLARLKGRPLRDASLVSVIGAPLSATFTVTEVGLWKSEVTDEGAVHTLVASQELA
jgi:2'-5' RNA ligase